MATKFKIANMSLRENITTVQGKKVIILINKTFKVRTGNYFYFFIPNIYFKEAQKSCWEFYQASQETKLWGLFTMAGIWRRWGGHLFPCWKIDKFNPTLLNIPRWHLEIGILNRSKEFRMKPESLWNSIKKKFCRISNNKRVDILAFAFCIEIGVMLCKVLSDFGISKKTWR